MGKIIRTKTQAKGGLTPEELERMKKHSEQWIKNAYRTEPINKGKITEAIKGLYRVSRLKEPRVVIVPSPRVMAYAGAIATAWWKLKTLAATDDATLAATRAATLAATDDATDDATLDATLAATDDAIRAATLDATFGFQAVAKQFLGSNFKLAVDLVGSWYSAYQGGNMWSYYDCFLSAFRVILGLALPIYEKYKYWEMAAQEGGFRYMHSEFCMVCDFPEILKVNVNNQPHCDGGPSHKWRDGWSFWYLNGVKVEQWMAETPPERLDAKKILQIENVDQRREVLRRLGVTNLVNQLGGKILDKDYTTKSNYELLELDIGLDTPCRYLKMKNPSIDAIHVEGVPNDCMTVQEAINWRRYGNKSLEWSPSQLT